MPSSAISVPVLAPSSRFAAGTLAAILLGSLFFALLMNHLCLPLDPPVPPPPVEQIHIHPPKLLPTPAAPTNTQKAALTLPPLDTAPPEPPPPTALTLPLARPNPPIGDLHLGIGVGDMVMAGGEALLADLDNIPRPLFQVPPRALRVKSTQTVVAELTVSADGSVASVTIISSDYAPLETRVREALLQWRFEPGLKNGKATAFRMRQQFDFRP